MGLSDGTDGWRTTFLLYKHQYHKTFKDRFNVFPVDIEMGVSEVRFWFIF
jgi:hypothetical protein